MIPIPSLQLSHLPIPILVACYGGYGSTRSLLSQEAGHGGSKAKGRIPHRGAPRCKNTPNIRPLLGDILTWLIYVNRFGDPTIMDENGVVSGGA